MLKIEEKELREELNRINCLLEYEILDTPPEKEFDDLVKLASQICETPISLITLLDQERQWFKANLGLNVNQTDRNIAFCTHAIQQNEIMVVPDATLDDRFLANPLVLGDPNIRFYAGVPLQTPDGFNLGTLCVIDRKPKELTDQQIFALKTLAKQVVSLLELRKNARKLSSIASTLEERNLELKKVNQSNNKLLSIIAHDLRSPFANLVQMLEILESGGLTNEQIQLFSKKIKGAVNNTQTLLDNLLQWAFAQFEGQNKILEATSLGDLISEVIEQNIDSVKAKGNKIEVKICEGEIVADGSMLKFIIRNLLVNANKFTQNGNIHIHAHQTDTDFIISILDSGVGIDPERIFQLFDWNLRKSTPGTCGEAGTGLGLQVCKELVELHNGKIWVESKINKGSVFHFTIPKSLK